VGCLHKAEETEKLT